jgi:AcrR family transcriptional regulator
MELDAASVSEGSLRARHREATRQELRAAAIRLFERDGFAQTSVDAIAREAGVSRSTFFRYYRSKEAVLAGERNDHTELFLDMLRNRPSSEARLEALEETLVAFAQHVRSDDRREEMLLIERITQADPSLLASRAAVIERWRRDVARVLATRGGREDPDLEDSLAAAVISQIVEQLGVELRTKPDDSPISELIRGHFAALRRLIAD